MNSRRVSFLIFVPLLLALAGFSRAQSGNPPASTPPEEQSDAFRDTLVKMRIKREEEEHKKLVKTATEVKDSAESLLLDLAGDKLPAVADKKLKEIEKGAKKIRSESGGGGNDQNLDPAPANLKAALEQLVEASKRLHGRMEKTSRHIISATVVANATEVIQLVKVIRAYLN